jgi:hypothetical protein
MTHAFRGFVMWAGIKPSRVSGNILPLKLPKMISKFILQAGNFNRKITNLFNIERNESLPPFSGELTYFKVLNHL